MAKVASMSWAEAARPPAASQGGTPHHVHFIQQDNINHIASALNPFAKRQTIANMLLPRNAFRSGNRAREQLSAALARGEDIRVISGMRDPVARSISWLTFMADFYGHTSEPLHPRSVIEADYVAATLRDVWRKVIEDEEPDDTFAWLAWYVTGIYARWFEIELAQSLNVDVGKKPFKVDQGARVVVEDNARVLLYRVEDMRPGAAAYPALLSAACEFLDTQMSAFPSNNVAANRRSQQLHGDVRERFRLPLAWLDKIYRHPIMDCFYNPDEIGAFKSRWAER
jgi:hypothetical protein